jgi:hypothetical protein
MRPVLSCLLHQLHAQTYRSNGEDYSALLTCNFSTERTRSTSAGRSRWLASSSDTHLFSVPSDGVVVEMRPEQECDIGDRTIDM